MIRRSLHAAFRVLALVVIVPTMLLLMVILSVTGTLDKLLEDDDERL